MRALLSVSDKTGIVEFAKSLESLGWDIISTGGTYKKLKENGVKVIEVNEVTKFPECFEGRVKTLNPYIHGGILHKRKEHKEEAEKLGVEGIDLVCVNLYPFKETIERTEDFDEIIENIDIGGPTMVRSSAKNFNDVLIVTDVNDYNKVIETLKNEENSFEFRRDLMIKAFEHTANYDSMIANYMNKRFNNGFGEYQFITGKKVMNTRYGENPHQKGALYQFGSFYDNLKTIKGEASFNNLTDMNGAIKVAVALGKGAVSIIKHANPCGASLKDNLLESYTEALKCDPISAYGGVVAINGILDEELAKKINEIFVEVIVAGRITDEAVKVFEKKKRIKLFELGNDELYIAGDDVDFKHIEGGFVYQDADKIGNDEIKKAKCVTKKQAEDFKDLEMAWKIAGLTKSNCVVYVKNGTMVAIGMGMTSRVDASQCALKKAKEMGLDVNGASLASEAFFPFRDSVDAAAKAGVKYIAQPGGSIRDDEVIASADENDIAMYFTGIRHFYH